MTKRTYAICVSLALVAGLAAADDKPETQKSEAPKASATPVIPLKVQLVLTRFQGDKKVSSMPYLLQLNSDHRTARIRLGIDVPVTVAGKDGQNQSQYRNVGTNIDCSAEAVEGGRFRLTCDVDESSVYTPEEGKGSGVGSATARNGQPLFRSFRTSFGPILADGQTSQIATAADPLSGEILKVDVTLNVLR